jgi:archaellum component FlaC|tara:strand:+ start:60 stop:350 length:291 start_codon:yes stop_codon:yes gene_type:complete
MEKQILDYLVKINSRLDNIENELKNIKGKINDELVDECKKMSNHIDFIDNVYDNVKNPLGYICNKLNFLSGEKEYKLDTIEDLHVTTEEQEESSND